MSWLKDNVGVLSFVVIALPLAWSVWRYLSIKNQEQRTKRFETYHDLIKQLVEEETPDKPKMLDRQLAVVFELRRFPEYFEPTLRIIKGLRESWEKEDSAEDKKNRLLEEMDASIKHIEEKSSKLSHRILQVMRGL